ncbi:LuxR C-terminal-related transcriptional regulator [Methylobacterium isbiliense]|uniref:HTH-type transcriptional regulator MalT n=1 Tax=Methylobacterium isbiliense TaxID=315478 RepID=A0ABQ4SH32_9HYPH|nr:LuxR C-terminal-related transcriptional regulator [Methylobacterium isbiliense]MDN3622333.1 LuxR C-terminal-related transcriptional regulator [Methylobacterium isbiliense]GJE01636.1 HTH-type transcriptional regulator MalT [Methylobacterium isbiliense]
MPAVERRTGFEGGEMPRSSRVVELTPRQRDVLSLLVEGKSNKEIARQLQLGEGTVKVHIAALLRGLGVQNRAAAAVVGARLLAG